MDTMLLIVKWKVMCKYFLIYAEEAHWSHLSPEYQLSIKKKNFRYITEWLNNIF